MASLVKRPGRRNWYVVYWKDGKQVWRSTGTPRRAEAQLILEGSSRIRG